MNKIERGNRKLPKAGDKVRLHDAYKLGLEPEATVVSVRLTSEDECEGGAAVTLLVQPVKLSQHEETLSITWLLDELDEPRAKEVPT